MKIGIDATGLHPTGGPTTYTKNLILALNKMNIQDEVIIYTTREFQDVFPSHYISRIIPRIIREGIYLPYRYRKDRLDIILEPKGYTPHIQAIKKLVVIHDIIPLENPASESFPARIYWRYTIPKAIRYGDWIITDSEWSRRRIIQRFPEVVNKISVIPIGIDTAMVQNRTTLEEIEERYPIKDGYILFVGTIKIRKGIPVLISAFERIKKAGFPHKLIIAGRYEYGSREIIKFVQKSIYRNDIIFTGTVSERVRNALYKWADMFIYPSIEEGFGLPVLEAMAFGIPVITTEIDAIKEVGGNAVLYFNGKSVEMLSRQIKKILADKSFREKLKIKAQSRVRELFSLETFGKSVWDVINKLYKRNFL